MINFLQNIEQKIKNAIKPEKLSLIDNSYLHTKHKSFDPKKYHLKVIIESKKLSKLSKIESHKVIFNILSNEMKSSIHALEIEIK